MAYVYRRNFPSFITANLSDCIVFSFPAIVFLFF